MTAITVFRANPPPSSFGERLKNISHRLDSAMPACDALIRTRNNLRMRDASEIWQRPVATHGPAGLRT
jgi:hypothetical protein